MIPPPFSIIHPSRYFSKRKEDPISKTEKKHIIYTGNLVDKFSKDIIDARLVTKDQMTLAKTSSDNLGIDLAQILISRGYVTEEQLLTFLAKKLNLPFEKPKSDDVDNDVLRVFPLHLAKKHVLFPLKHDEKNRVIVFMADPTDGAALEDLRGYYPEGIDKRLGSAQTIFSLLEKHHSQANSFESENIVMELAGGDADDVTDDMEVKKIQEIASGPKIIATVNNIIAHAKKDGASDIHIEPFRDGCRLRYRVDGILHDRGNLPKNMHLPIVSRIKIMASLDIAEKRIPHDGRARVRLMGKPLDMRINTCPTQFGEKVVIRLFSKDNTKTIESLGFLDREKKVFTNIITKPNGIFLVTGPTGSGKSSTLYAGLMRINSPEINIMTIEDPIENELEGVNQIAINEKAGLTFSKILRAAMRQDPDVIMLGEIRDAETASIAVRAAITGHLVLSTLHTNSAVGAIDRLKDIGVESFMIASSLRGSMAQRLVRRICKHCREEIPVDNIYNIPLKKNFKGKGCEECSFTGFAGGRIGIFELVEIDHDVQRMIHKNVNSDEIARFLKEKGNPTIIDDGIVKVEMGWTTIDEVMRVTAED